jgi:radical SAM C-methyltransferase
VFAYDVPAILAALRAGEEPNLRPTETSLDLYYRLGAETFTTTTNSEEIVHFMGLTKDALRIGETELVMSSDGPFATVLRETGSC